MAEDLENDEWISIDISIFADASGIIKVKKEFEEYAKELRWKTKVDKKGYVDENGVRMYEIKISPKGGKISPEELRVERDIINGFAWSVLRDMIYADKEDQLPKPTITWETYGKKEEILKIVGFDVLTIECELKKAIKLELELENPNLFKNAFNMSLKEEYDINFDEKDKIFLSSKKRKRAEAIVRVLEDNGMPKHTTKKKNILKRLF